MTLDVLQDRIGYRFKDESLLVLAVTHSSWANEHSAGNAHNERLEFLGDAVLEIAVSAQLFARFPDAREGELTRLRSSLVNEATLAVIARKNIGLSQRARHTAPKTIRGKVLAYLSSQASAQGSRTFDIPFDRQQLADYLCVDRSALSAELGRMKREGIIDVRKNRFVLNN